MLSPLLIFLGIPPLVAVASGANQVLGASVSGVLSHWQRGDVDTKMGLILTAGGFCGSGFGIWLLSVLRGLGQIDLVINLSYVILLTVLGSLMLSESLHTLYRRSRGALFRRKLHQHSWIHRLPLKTRFRRSRLYISVLAPFAVGAVTGVLSAIMGVGGGFIMIPAMIYVLQMPTQVVVGTSLFQITFVSANVTVLQAINNQSVDVVLAMILLAGGVIGAQFGARAGRRFKADQLRFLLAVVVFGMGVKLGIDQVTTPAHLYSLATF